VTSPNGHSKNVGRLSAAISVGERAGARRAKRPGVPDGGDGGDERHRPPPRGQIEPVALDDDVITHRCLPLAIDTNSGCRAFTNLRWLENIE